ncbi:MAG: hypothetical protein HWN66_15110 [Candidatus Helarchaeota archaeon]|nr:hypothetical protein [Candidatus Helarchaeota archaeon]
MAEEKKKITMMDDEIEMYTEILKEGTPFDRFVSRGDVRDTIDIKSPRAEVERLVRRALRSTIADGTPRLVPIVGIAGTGKTHFYWALKDLEEIEEGNWVCVYVPSPPTPVRSLLHIYTCLADEVNELLDRVSSQIIETYGKKGKLFGPSIKEVINHAVKYYPGVAVDVVRALIIYAMAKDQSLKAAAERWLLGENFTEEELEKLKLNSVLEADDVCLATLKIFAQNLNKVIILYFDELEIPFRTFGPEAEIRLLETIKRLYNELPNILIITACLEEVWNRILNDLADPALKSRMEKEAHLKPFEIQDIEEFYISAMQNFWENEKNVPLPADPLFPLTEKIFADVHRKSNGNPRESIKIIRDYMDMVLYGEGLPKLAFPEITPSVTRALSILEEIKPVKSSVQMTIGSEEYVINVNPSSVAGAAIDSISTLARQQNKPLEINLAFEFKGKGGKSKKLAGIIEEKDSNQKYGIEVPSVKTFDRSGGVAAYYAANRVIDAITTGAIDKSILIVPKGTAGKKYTSIIESASDSLTIVELVQSEAESLIKGAKKNPSLKGREIARAVFPTISLEAPEPTAEEVASISELTEAPSKAAPKCPFCQNDLTADNLKLLNQGFNAICSKCHKIIRVDQV